MPDGNRLGYQRARAVLWIKKHFVQNSSIRGKAEAQMWFYFFPRVGNPVK